MHIYVMHASVNASSIIFNESLKATCQCHCFSNVQMFLINLCMLKYRPTSDLLLLFLFFNRGIELGIENCGISLVLVSTTTYLVS